MDVSSTSYVLSLFLLAGRTYAVPARAYPAQLAVDM